MSETMRGAAIHEGDPDGNPTGTWAFIPDLSPDEIEGSVAATLIVNDPVLEACSAGGYVAGGGDADPCGRCVMCHAAATLASPQVAGTEDSRSHVRRLRDAAMVFAAAPLEIDTEAGERFAIDCDNAADEIVALNAEIARIYDGIAVVHAGWVWSCECGDSGATLVSANDPPSYCLSCLRVGVELRELFYRRAPTPPSAASREPDTHDESLRCSCEWMHPMDGTVGGERGTDLWPAVLDPHCSVHRQLVAPTAPEEPTDG